MRRLRILVADDNPLSLRFLIEALAILGHETVEAEDGRAALDLATTTAFDVLLLDANMPGYGGAEVLARARAQATAAHHAIALATTADNDSAVHARLLYAGFGAVLVKPFRIDTLRAILEQQVADLATTNEALDDTRALAAVGGDAAILAALRGLLACELDALPNELAGFSREQDANAFRDRLHRLDASAGFCGVPALVHAAAAVRRALDGPLWPHAAVTRFLGLCARFRVQLER